MGYEPKTKPTDASVVAFIEQVESPKKREDAYRLLDIFHEVTGMEPVMWGPSIIGYGSYHYRYASGHEGNAAMTGFSPRKAAHSLYLGMEEERQAELLQKLGKHRVGKACVYVNKLDDIDIGVLKQMIRETVDYVQKLYPQGQDGKRE